jgi:hypothetical protein
MSWATSDPRRNLHQDITRLIIAAIEVDPQRTGSYRRIVSPASTAGSGCKTVSPRLETSDSFGDGPDSQDLRWVTSAPNRKRHQPSPQAGRVASAYCSGVIPWQRLKWRVSALWS